MKKYIKLILTLSILLNILCITVGSYEVYRKGGVGWVSLKVNSMINSKDYKKQPDYYFIKKSIYDDLNMSNDAIVFVGDSITDNFEWGEYFKNYNIQNRGISGDTISGILNRITSISNENPKSIFIMAGINDFRNGATSEYVYNKYMNIINKIQEDSPNTNIYIQSTLPVNIKMANHYYDLDEIIKLNLKLSELSNKNEKIKYFDLYELLKASDGQLDAKYTYDGVHLNTLGYSVWTKTISKFVN